MEFGSCLQSGTRIFEVASRFSEILRTPAFFYTVLLQIGGWYGRACNFLLTHTGDFHQKAVLKYSALLHVGESL